MPNLTRAALDEFSLDLETISDTRDNAIVKYEIPYRDGAILRNTGNKARTVEFRCYFFDDTYADHYFFIDHCSIDRIFELHHPSYGLMQGRIESVKVTHNNEFDKTAEIDITFATEGAPFIDPQPFGSIDSEIESLFAASQALHFLQVANDLVDSVGNEIRSAVNRVLDPAQNIVNQFTDLSFSAREVLGEIDNGMARAETLLSSVTVPIDSMTAVVQYPSTIAGRVVGSLSRVCARYSASVSALASSPRQCLSNLAASFSLASNQFSDTVFPLKKHFNLAAAQAISLHTGILYASDDTLRAVMKKREAVKSFDISGRFLSPPSAPDVMTANDLEATLAIVRKCVQDSTSIETSAGRYTDIARSMSQLRAMASALVRHVSAVKLEREKIVVRLIPAAIPMHLVCLHEGLPYQYADRIMSLNPSVQNPSFSRGNVSVYVG
jgi:prophage DNA circulation protein